MRTPEEADPVLKSARPLARSVLIVPRLGSAALQNGLPTAKRLMARLVLNPAAHAHIRQEVTVPVWKDLTDRVGIVQQVIGHTARVEIDIVVTVRLHQEAIVQLA